MELAIRFVNPQLARNNNYNSNNGNTHTSNSQQLITSSNYNNNIVNNQQLPPATASNNGSNHATSAYNIHAIAHSHRSRNEDAEQPRGAQAGKKGAYSIIPMLPIDIARLFLPVACRFGLFLRIVFN